ncbi:MAG: hypothetical protein KFW07_03990 [Mycoplasmataceae bacterium]|nr:hypothetical protein [Mycoplasmataceae bacterium]
MLDFIDREISRSDISKVINSPQKYLKINININLVFELFENKKWESITSFDISEFIYKQSSKPGTFAYNLKNKVESNSKSDIIYCLLNKYPYLEKQENNIKVEDNKMENFLNTLNDAITGNISKKESMKGMINSITQQLTKYQKYYIEILETIKKYDVSYKRKWSSVLSWFIICKEKSGR